MKVMKGHSPECGRGRFKKRFFFIFVFLLCSLGCTTTFLDTAQIKVTAGPPRNITQNDLPLMLSWHKPLTNGRPNVKLPVACYQDRGVVLSWLPDQKDWQGTALFDSNGNVLWNHADEVANAVTLDDKAVYIFDAPKLSSYDIHSGELLWETDEGVGYRLSAYLFVEGNELHFVSDKRFNIYQKESGQLLAQENIPAQNLVLRHNNIDFHSGDNLYATDAAEPQTILWTSEAYATRLFLPQIYDDSLLVQSPGPGINTVCRVSMDDGQVIWCEDKRLLSNIATHNDIGYAVNDQDELIGFRLTDGVDVGKVIFQPKGTHELKSQYHVASCDEHLLIYFASPEELFWFDFVK